MVKTVLRLAATGEQLALRRTTSGGARPRRQTSPAGSSTSPSAGTPGSSTSPTRAPRPGTSSPASSCGPPAWTRRVSSRSRRRTWRGGTRHRGRPTPSSTTPRFGSRAGAAPQLGPGDHGACRRADGLSVARAAASARRPTSRAGSARSSSTTTRAQRWPGAWRACGRAGSETSSSWTTARTRGLPRPGKLARSPSFPVRLIAPPRNLGYGAGANLGAGNSGFELLFICNPDLVVQPERRGATRPGARRPSRRRRGRADAPRSARLGVPLRPVVSRASATLSATVSPACSGGTTRGRAGTVCSAPTSTGRGTPTGCQAPASSCAAAPSRPWAASTSPISCTSRTWTSAGGCTGPGGRCSTSRRPTSSTSKAVRPRATPTGCSPPTTARS